jgi:hypothetical protein
VRVLKHKEHKENHEEHKGFLGYEIIQLPRLLRRHPFTLEGEFYGFRRDR